MKLFMVLDCKMKSVGSCYAGIWVKYVIKNKVVKKKSLKSTKIVEKIETSLDF